MAFGEMPQVHRNRFLVLAALLAIGFAAIGAQLIRYQILMHRNLEETADTQRSTVKNIEPPRGVILDVNRSFLALNSTQWEINASPDLIAKPQELSVQMSEILGIPQDDLYAKLSKKGQDWLPIAKYVPLEPGEQILALSHPGLVCHPLTNRVYPSGELLAHITGIVNASGDGFYGIEGYYNQILRGSRGKEEFEHDSGGQPIPLPPEIQQAASEGASLILTIDSNIQFIAYEQLQWALEEYGAKRGSVVIMNPKTGALLASVSHPTYDPNHFGDANIEDMSDPVVSSLFEPGSIFKIVTWSAGLDTGTISPGTTFYDDGAMEVGGRVIRNSDRRGHGLVTMADGLTESLNTVAAYISTSVGKDSFYTYLRRFGFGTLTGVDLASEGPGMMKLPGDSNWFPSDLGTNSFGQGIAVTPIQMVAAAAAVANRGLLMQPYVVDSFIQNYGTEDEQIIKREPLIVRRAISEDTAAVMTDLLTDVVDTWASQAQVPGYRVAGKTGTAEIPTAYGYHPTDTIASFVGFAPADDPQFIILVQLDRPETSPWGSQTAAPTFKRIAERLFVYMHIPPDDVRMSAGLTGP